MSRTADTSAVRASAAARAVWGGVLLVAPRQVLGVVGSRRSDLAVATLRFMGVRHLVQAAAMALRPNPTVLAIGAGVDALHGVTAALLAGLDPHQRGMALTETGLAIGEVASGVSIARAGVRC